MSESYLTGEKYKKTINKENGTIDFLNFEGHMQYYTSVENEYGKGGCILSKLPSKPTIVIQDKFMDMKNGYLLYHNKSKNEINIMPASAYKFYTENKYIEKICSNIDCMTGVIAHETYELDFMKSGEWFEKILEITGEKKSDFIGGFGYKLEKKYPEMLDKFTDEFIEYLKTKNALPTFISGSSKCKFDKIYDGQSMFGILWNNIIKKTSGLPIKKDGYALTLELDKIDKNKIDKKVNDGIERIEYMMWLEKLDVF